REKAAYNTSCSGEVSRLNGTSMTLYATAYVPSDAAPRKRPMSRLSVFEFSSLRTSVPETLPPKPASARRLRSEYVKRGRHGEKSQSSDVAAAVAASCCAMIAHGPKPSA